MKKLLSAITVCASVMLFAAKQIQIDQSTQRAALESCIKAVQANNDDAIIALMPPATMQKLIAANGDVTSVKIMFTILRMDNRLKIKRACEEFNTPAAREDLLKKLMLHKNYFVYADGKWYVDFRVLFPRLSAADQQAQREVVIRFLRAKVNGNGKEIIECIAPDSRAGLMKQFGSEEKFHAQVAEAAQKEDPKKREEYLRTLDDEQWRRQMLPHIMMTIEFVKVNGKWYIR